MQKENLSALMDGEVVDEDLLTRLSNDKSLQQSWKNYHLIRDIIRNDVSSSILINIADRVCAAIENETIQFIAESQPEPESWLKLPFWSKVRPWFTHLGQAGVAAGVSLAVIVGVQNYNVESASQTGELTSFSAFRISGPISQVSYDAVNSNIQNLANVIVKDQRKRITIMQDYELQRRINSQPIVIEEDVDSTLAK